VPDPELRTREGLLDEPVAAEVVAVGYDCVTENNDQFDGNINIAARGRRRSAPAPGVFFFRGTGFEGLVKVKNKEAVQSVNA
jgi:hypothetical protein